MGVGPEGMQIRLQEVFFCAVFIFVIIKNPKGLLGTLRYPPIVWGLVCGLVFLISVLIGGATSGNMPFFSVLKAGRLVFMFLAATFCATGVLNYQVAIEWMVRFGILQAVILSIMWQLDVPLVMANQTLHTGPRLGGFFGDAVCYGLFTSLLLILGFVYAVNGKTRLQRIEGILCFIANFAATIFSGTRSSFLAVAVALLVWFIITKNKKLRLAMLIAVIFLLVFVVLSMVLDIVPSLNFFIRTRIIPLFQFTKYINPAARHVDVSSSRFFIWQQYLDILANQPVWRWFTGYGYHEFIEFLGVKEHIYGENGVILYSVVGRSTHNQFLYSIFAAGVPGLIVLVGSLVSPLKAAWRMRRTLVGEATLLLIIVSVITMVFADVMTMVAAEILVFVMVSFVCLLKKESFRQDENVRIDVPPSVSTSRHVRGDT